MKILKKKSSGSVTKNIALIMSLVMMVTLMPWGMLAMPTVEAATGNITLDWPANKGKESTNPVNVSDRHYRLTGSFTGIVVSSISYTVKNLGTGHIEQGGAPYNTPGTNIFTYDNIPLTPGLNEITVGHQSGLSQKIFVFFNDMPGIFNLTVNGLDLVYDELVVNQNVIPGQSIAGSFTGLATNATTVEITNETLIMTNQNARIAAQVFGGTGLFTGTLPLVAGENVITYVAKNETKSIQETRRIIVNSMTAGAGLNVYNLQSHYRTIADDIIIKAIPKGGEVDFEQGESNESLANKPPTLATQKDLEFTGRIISNIPGNGYLELNKFINLAGQRIHSDLLFDIRNEANESVIIGGAFSLIEADADSKAVIDAYKSIHEFSNKMQELLALTDNIINMGVGVLNSPVNAGQRNLITTQTTRVASYANNITAVDEIPDTILDLDLAAFKGAGATVAATALDDTSLWTAAFIADVEALKTAARALRDAINDNADPDVDIDAAYAKVDIAAALLAAGHDYITKDTKESDNNTHYYDFVTPKIVLDAAKMKPDTRYIMVMEPVFYRANPNNLTDYTDVRPIEYDFIYVDSKAKKITSLQNADTLEVIFDSTGTTNHYRVSQQPFNLRVNFNNLEANDRIYVRHKSAPFGRELWKVTLASDDVDAEKYEDMLATDITNGYKNISLDGLLPGNNLIEVYMKGANPGDDPITLVQRVVLVTTTPIVTINSNTGELANNRVYEYRFDPSKPASTYDAFMRDNFGNVVFTFEGISDKYPLGGANNRVSIKLNDTYVNEDINEVGVGLASNADYVTITANNTSTIIQSIKVDFTKLFLSTGERAFREGLNTLTVEFRNGNNPVRVEINFYLFTDSAPEITDITITDHSKPTGSQETLLTDYEPYETDGDLISIKGKIKYADGFVLRIQGEDVVIGELNETTKQWKITELRPVGFTIKNPTVTSVGDESEFTINRYKLENPSDSVLQGTFIFAFEVSKAQTTTNYPVTISKKVEPYTVLAPYRAVVNNNFQKVIIRSESAVSVTIGKDQAERIRINNRENVMSVYVTDWLESHLYGSNEGLIKLLGTDGEVFFAEVALKKGANKIPITVNFGNQQVSGTIDIYYAATPETGAIYKADLTKSGKIETKDWGNPVQVKLDFPKGTLLKKKDLNLYGEYERYDDYYEIPSFWTDKQLLIAIADHTSGKVDRDIAKSTRADLRMSLNNTYYNNYFQFSSPLFYIDAGDVKHPGGRLPYEAPEIVTRNAEDALEPTNPGTITLAYNQSIVMDAGPHLAVMYNPGYTSIGSDAGWQNLGGTVNTKNNTISVPFAGFGYYTVMKLNRGMADMSGHPWARRYLEAMFSKGIMISEPGTNRFGTDLNITRGEFVTMLVKALNIPINAGPYVRQGLTLRPVDSSFDDILPGMGDFFWSYEYVETAARAGIIQGKAPGLFMPNEQLTREQAATIIARAINAKLVRTPELALTQLTKEFTDAGTIDHYALQSIAAINKTGIVVGKQNDPNDPSRGFSFLPKNNLTRAEAATIATRLMQSKKLLPDPL